MKLELFVKPSKADENCQENDQQRKIRQSNIVSILITFQAWICFIWKAKLEWIFSLHCLGTLQKGECKWAHQRLGRRGNKKKPDTHIDALSYSAWLDLNGSVFMLCRHKKMEPFTWHDQRRLHQRGISGGTNVDVPRLFWQRKPNSVGESQLQSGAFTDRRHTNVSDKSNAAMEGDDATWPFISHERENTKKWKMEYITPGPWVLASVPHYGFRYTSVHKTQRQYWNYIKVVLFKSDGYWWSLFRHDPSLPALPLSSSTESKTQTPTMIPLTLHFRASVFIKLWHMWILEATKRTLI